MAKLREVTEKQERRFKIIASILSVGAAIAVNLGQFGETGSSLGHILSFVAVGIGVASLWAADKVWDWLNADSARIVWGVSMVGGLLLAGANL